MSNLVSHLSVKESERLAREIASLSKEHAIAILMGAAEALIGKGVSSPQDIQYVCQTDLMAGTRIIDVISVLKSSAKGKLRGDTKAPVGEAVQFGTSQPPVMQMAG